LAIKNLADTATKLQVNGLACLVHVLMTSQGMMLLFNISPDHSGLDVEDLSWRIYPYEFV